MTANERFEKAWGSFLLLSSFLFFRAHKSFFSKKVSKSHYLWLKPMYMIDALRASAFDFLHALNLGQDYISIIYIGFSHK